jgi:serine/threonine-protein kinase RsbW
MDNVQLIIPKKSEFISTIRLTTSALSNLSSFNVDDIEDLKVIAAEVCIFFMNNIEKNEQPLIIEYYIEKNKFKAVVTDSNKGKITEESKRNSEMCMLIIESLADEYAFDLENNKISFEKQVK